MASPGLGLRSERAWSPAQTNGGTGASPPAQAAWPSPAAAAAVQAKKSWEGVLRLGWSI